MVKMHCPCVLVIAGCVLVVASAGHANWPGWRGDGSGTTEHRNLPLHWDDEVGVAWKTLIPGEGNGSPVIWGDRLFVTASVEGGQTRLVLALDVKTGNILWQTPLASSPTKTYPRAGHAAATPVADARRIYAFFDTPGLVALTHDGDVVWQVSLGPFSNPYNMASSPILVGDMVVMKCDHQGPSFITAVSRSDGTPRWRTEREGGLHYATPLAIHHQEAWQIVVNAEPIVAYDAISGAALWSCRGMKHATTPSPLYRDGLVYATCGRNGPTVAIDPSGRGDVTNTHVRMHVTSGGPYVPSPVMLHQVLIIPGDDGRITAIDGKGRRRFRHRLRGRFTASPVVSGRRLYWTDEKACTHVLELRDRNDSEQVHELATLAVNALVPESCYASPAIAAGRYFIRTRKHLYCVVGGATRLAASPTADLPGDFDALRSRYRAEPASEHDNTMIRLEIVEKLAGVRHPEVVDFLVEIIDRDGHWDVTEAALRELGRHGQAAESALIAMFDRSQPFYKTVAAEHLAALTPVGAIPVLTRSALKDSRQVRVASVEALGRIAEAHRDRADEIARTMITLLEDPIGLVRHAAVVALKMAADGLVDLRPAVVEALTAACDDANPLVAEEAGIVLELAFATGR